MRLLAATVLTMWAYTFAGLRGPVILGFYPTVAMCEAAKRADHIDDNGSTIFYVCEEPEDDPPPGAAK